MAAPLIKSATVLLFNNPVAVAVTTLSVDEPVLNVEAVTVPVNVELPVTPNVPPTVVLPLKVDAPVTPKVPPTEVLPLNVLLPAIVCVPAVIKPLADAEALGILKVCAVPVEEILKLLPVESIVRVCVAPVNPFSEVMAAPLNINGVQTGLPLVPVFTLNTLSVVLKSNKPVAGRGIAFC